jgi:hypothetical protein
MSKFNEFISKLTFSKPVNPYAGDCMQEMLEYFEGSGVPMEIRLMYLYISDKDTSPEFCLNDVNIIDNINVIDYPTRPFKFYSFNEFKAIDTSKYIFYDLAIRYQGMGFFDLLSCCGDKYFIRRDGGSDFNECLFNLNYFSNLKNIDEFQQYSFDELVDLIKIN